jgi:glutamine cyclotransferase
MFKFILILFGVIMINGCQQNGDINKKRALDFEEVSKELSNLNQNNNIEDYERNTNNPIAPIQKIKVVNKFPHDPNAYTQGLLYHKGYLYESTGLVGSSSLRKVELKTGKVVKQINVAGGMFAEGIEIFNDKIYQLTWTSQICLIYDLSTLKKISEYRYNGEGWGLARFGDNLLMSNGTGILKVLKVEDFSELKKITVNDNGRPIYYLNELEQIEDEIWANIYGSNRIARIDPKTGKVNSYLDLSKLYDFVEPGDNPEVLNGIAYDKENRRIFVTGKYWKYVFEIEVLN